MNMTATDETPELYRQWAAISMIGGVLENRVWALSRSRAGKPRRTYPNMYIFLVGVPGVGKAVVESVQELWSDVRGQSDSALHLADSSLTRASLVDQLAVAERTFIPPVGPPLDYHSILVAAEEFGVFLQSHDISYISVLNMLFNCPSSYTEKRRTGSAKSVEISSPVMNILAGVQPGWLATTFPEEAWLMGLPSRIIMIYGNVGPPGDPFLEVQELEAERKLLLQGLNRLANMYGQMKWSQEAKAKIRDWNDAGGPPRPTHSKLEYYCNRRLLNVMKLSIISAASRSRGRSYVIEYEDASRALGWLLEAEKLMPDIFRAMIGRSDHQVIEELYMHLVNLHRISGGKPVHVYKLYNFAMQRVPSDKVQKIVEIAEKANMIERIGGTETYVPKARTDFVE